MLKALGVEMHAGDITDRESLRQPMTGVDGVFHVAAWYKVGVKSARGRRVNVDGTRNVLRSPAQLAIPRGVYTSTVAVFGDTHGARCDETYYERGPFLTEYDRYEVDRALRRRGAEDRSGPAADDRHARAGLRPRRYQRHARRARRSAARTAAITPAKPRFAGATSKTPPAACSWRWSGAAGRELPLTGPIHTFEDAFALAATIARRRRPPIHPPPLLMRGAARVAEAVERWNFQFPHAAETLRLMAGTTWIGSSAKAEQALGFTVRPLDEGLRHTVEHESRQLGLS